MDLNELEHLMMICLSEAEKAYKANEVPVGAIVIDEMGRILAKSHNNREGKNNPCGHAEILALQEAAQKKNSWRLLECYLIVSLEPCVMCLAAALQARIKHIVFGAYDPKGGALSLGYGLHKDARFHHTFAVTGGILQYETGRIISQFFKERRNYYQAGKKMAPISRH